MGLSGGRAKPVCAISIVTGKQGSEVSPFSALLRLGQALSVACLHPLRPRIRPPGIVSMKKEAAVGCDVVARALAAIPGYGNDIPADESARIKL